MLRGHSHLSDSLTSQIEADRFAERAEPRNSLLLLGRSHLSGSLTSQIEADRFAERALVVTAKSLPIWLDEKPVIFFNHGYKRLSMIAAEYAPPPWTGVRVGNAYIPHHTQSGRLDGTSMLPRQKQGGL